jgi:hypothetical protein
MREVFGKCEYRAEKDGQVFKSKGYKDVVGGNWIIPTVAPKQEKKDGRKMSNVRTSKKAYK